jgi:RNA polymerase sigma-70 factor (ECF subfamily)
LSEKNFSKERELLQAGYRYALSLVHHQQDAEDVVQTACLKLYSKKGWIKQKALLFKTIRNLVFDQHRRQKVVQFQALEDHHTTHEDGSLSPETYAISTEINVLFERLRPEEREALYLHIVEGYTAREIGKLSGQPRNTVLSLLHRGKQKLKQAMAADAES